MALIYWLPEYNTNIEILDRQHRLLVDILNELHEAYSAGKDRQMLLKLLGKLAVYAATHFAREEHFFAIHGYPDMEEHLEEHDDFEDTIAQFEDQFRAGNQDLSLNVLTFLSDWLVNHINGSDRSYVPYLSARGVS